MRAYSEDLRTKIVRATERGMPKAEAARLFSVSLSSVKRYARAAREGDSLAPSKGGGRPRRRTRDYKEDPRGGRKGAARRHHRLRQAPRAGALDRYGPQRLYRAEALEAPRLQPKKGLWGRWSEMSG